MCSPSRGAWRVWRRAGPAGEPHRQGAAPRPSRSPDGRPPRRTPGPASCARSGCRCGCTTLPTGTPGVPEELRRCRRPAVAGTTPAGARRSGRAPATRPAAVASAGSAAQAGSPSTSRSAAHCASVATAIATQQSSRPYSSTPAVWYRFCGAAAGPRLPARSSSAPYGRVLDHLLGGDVQRGVDHRRLDQAPLAGAVAVLEGEQQPEQRVQPGVGIADAVGLDGQPVRLAGQPGEPGRVLDHEGERRPGPATGRRARSRASAP